MIGEPKFAHPETCLKYSIQPYVQSNARPTTRYCLSVYCGDILTFSSSVAQSLIMRNTILPPRLFTGVLNAILTTATVESDWTSHQSLPGLSQPLLKEKTVESQAKITHAVMATESKFHRLKVPQRYDAGLASNVDSIVAQSKACGFKTASKSLFGSKMTKLAP